MSMDAMELIRARNRMCKTFPSCEECPAFGVACYDNAAWNEKIVPIVEKWAEEHPIKTRQSEFLKQWPNAELDTKGVLLIHPCRIDTENYEDKGLFCPVSCPECRREFWSQEVK